MVCELSQGRSLQERSIRSLQRDNVVVFINGQKRQNLYDLVISRIHDHPTLSLHVSMIERWQEELVTSYNIAKIPLTALLEQMRVKGSLLQSETAIRFWLWGQVMCPHDSKDLLRIAEILNMTFVKQYHIQIYKAAQRLRGIHISLARKLNVWLEQEVFSSNKESFNDVIDEELGLEFNDFKEALSILTVESIKEEMGLFLTSELGQLQLIN